MPVFDGTALFLKGNFSGTPSGRVIGHMALDEGLGVTETARRLSIPAKTLANWVALYRQDAQGFATGPGVSEQEAELARLKKENALLRMERDILKKAAAYFAKESL